jgi:flagellar FliJ protein
MRSSRETLLRLHRFRTEEKRRQVADIEAMIADLMRKYDDLDAQMKIEEQRTGVNDPAHFNYSMAAKSTRARRDNILKTVGDLKDQQSAAQARAPGREGTRPPPRYPGRADRLRAAPGDELRRKPRV